MKPILALCWIMLFVATSARAEGGFAASSLHLLDLKPETKPPDFNPLPMSGDLPPMCTTWQCWLGSSIAATGVASTGFGLALWGATQSYAPQEYMAQKISLFAGGTVLTAIGLLILHFDHYSDRLAQIAVENAALRPLPLDRLPPPPIFPYGMHPGPSCHPGLELTLGTDF